MTKSLSAKESELPEKNETVLPWYYAHLHRVFLSREKFLKIQRNNVICAYKIKTTRF